MTTDLLQRTALETRTAHGKEWALNYVRNIPAFLANPPIDALAGRFEDVTAVIVGAGPSLARNIHLLQDRHIRPRLVVLASATAYKPMLAAGVIPDVVLAAEKIPMDEYFGCAEDDEVRLFINDVAHPSLHGDQACKERYVVYNQDASLNKRFARHFGATRHVASGGNVTTQAMDIAMAMGVRRIVLIGCDFAYDPAGQAHVEGSIYSQKRATHTWYGFDEDSFIEEEGVYGVDNKPYKTRHKIHWLTGLDGQPVASRDDWAAFHAWTEQWVERHSKRGLRAINATEGGAMVKGMTHMSLELALATTKTRVVTEDDWNPSPHPAGHPLLHTASVTKELKSMERLLGAIWHLVEDQNKPDADVAVIEALLAPLIERADFMREALNGLERDLTELDGSDRILDVMRYRNLSIIHFCGTMLPEIERVRKEIHG